MLLFLLYGLGNNDFSENYLMGIYDTKHGVYQELATPSGAWKGNVYMLRRARLNERVEFDNEGDDADEFYYVVKEGSKYHFYFSSNHCSDEQWPPKGTVYVHTMNK